MRTPRIRAVLATLIGLTVYSYATDVRSANVDTKNRQSVVVMRCEQVRGVGGLVAPGGTAETCTKWCADCNGCDVYCCEGTTPGDIGVLAIEDDE